MLCSHLYHACDAIQILVARLYVNGELRSKESADEVPMFWAPELSSNREMFEVSRNPEARRKYRFSCPEYYIAGILENDPDFRVKARTGVDGLLAVAEKRGLVSQKGRAILTEQFLRFAGKPAIVQGLNLDAREPESFEDAPWVDEVITECVIGPDQYRTFTLSVTGSLIVL